MSIRTGSTVVTSAMDDSLGYQVNLTGKLFAAALSAALPKGMTTTQVGLLAWIAEHPRQSQREISTGTGVDTATLTEMLRRLHARGVVRREPDPADARRMLVTLTDADDPALQEAIQAAEDVNGRAIRGMTPDEVAQLSSLLTRVRANLLTPDDAPVAETTTARDAHHS